MSSPFTDLQKMLRSLESSDREETERFGAPLREIIFIFPAFRKDGGKAEVLPEFAEYYYQSLNLGLNCELSEFVDGIYRMRKPPTLKSIFD